MRNELLRQLIDFTALGVVLGLSLFGLYFFRGQIDKQIIITILLGVSYVVWGIVHHKEHHDLHLKIIIEYLLVAVMAVILFGSLLLRA